MIWGGEACAVRPDGRANPKQLVMTQQSQADIAALREIVVKEHRAAVGDDRGLVIGLQLTHSGRFCKPNDNTKFESVIAYNHPILDRKFGYPADRPVMSDDEIRRLIDDFVVAAKRAQQCGYDFVDIKHCHGYLAHEFLSAVTRPGPYRRFTREPHALPARGRRGRSRGGAGLAYRRAAERGRHRCRSNPTPHSRCPARLDPEFRRSYTAPYPLCFRRQTRTTRRNTI